MWTSFIFLGCRKSCPQDRVDQLLCVCLCRTITIEGLVLSHRLLIPLNNATITLHSSSTASSTTTDSLGHFKTHMGTCDGEYSMVANKKGYQEVRLNMEMIKDHWYSSIEMKDAGTDNLLVRGQKWRLNGHSSVIQLAVQIG